MQRRLLRDGQIVIDDWRYVAEAAADPSAPLIVTWDQWRLEPDPWLARGSRLGVVLSPEHHVRQWRSDLRHFSCLPRSSPGRARDAAIPRQGSCATTGISGANCARWVMCAAINCSSWRAAASNSFELPDTDIEDAYSAFTTFTVAYQPSNDFGLGAKGPRAAE